MTEAARNPFPMTALALKNLPKLRKKALMLGYALRPSYAPKLFEPSPNVALVLKRMAEK